VGVRWILSWLQNRFCTHVSASSYLCSLASEFCSCRGAFVDAAAQLVGCAIGCASSASGGAIAESRSTADDFLLVPQQLLRSTDRRRVDALPGGQAYSFHNTSQRGPVLPLRSVHSPVLVVVFRRRACRMEPLGQGHLLGADPSTPFFKRPRGIDNCAVSRDVGDDWNPATADSPTIALLGSMRAICWSVARKLRRPL
jgi:hypothetical protein